MLCHVSVCALCVRIPYSQAVPCLRRVVFPPLCHSHVRRLRAHQPIFGNCYLLRNRIAPLEVFLKQGGTSQTSCEDAPAHPSSRLPKGNKEFYVLAAVRAAADSRGVLTPHTVPRTLFRYAYSASCFASVANSSRKRQTSSSPPLRKTLSGVTNPTSACSAPLGNRRGSGAK